MAGRFKWLGGSAQRFFDNETNEEISRREMKKRAGQLSFEELRDFNKQQNPIASALRPAKGRKSALKASETEKQFIAQARIEDAKQKARIAAEERARKTLERKLKRQANKKVKQRRITKGMLKPGAYGARVSFRDYEGYLKALKQARAAGVIIGYSLGVIGYDENTAQDYGITVFKLQYIKDTISEDEFFEEMDAAIEARSYFVFSHYFIHLAFKKDYARSVYQASLKGTSRDGKKTRKQN